MSGCIGVSCENTICKCYYCENDRRFLELIGIVNSLVSNEEKQCRENGEVGKRIKELERYISLIESINNSRFDWVQNFNKLENKVKEIEEKISEKYAHPNVIGRLERLENIIKDNNGLIHRIGILGEALHVLSEENNKLKKTPHKCPVCNGEGRIKLNTPLVKDNETYYSISCNGCKEKCIIWG